MKNRNSPFKKNPDLRKLEKEIEKNAYLFAIGPVIIPLMISIAVFVAYYYITVNRFFPEWSEYVYTGAKIIIALQIFIAASRSLVGSILALLAGFANLAIINFYGIAIISIADTWQLIIAAAVGCLITFFRKL